MRRRLPRLHKRMAAKQVRDLLKAFLDEFDRAYRDDRPGWGQFLDGNSAARPQIGPYGTSAGAVLLGLNGLYDTARGKATRLRINEYLFSQPTEEFENFRRQTLRWAMLLIGYSVIQPKTRTPSIESSRACLAGGFQALTCGVTTGRVLQTTLTNRPYYHSIRSCRAAAR